MIPEQDHTHESVFGLVTTSGGRRELFGRDELRRALGPQACLNGLREQRLPRSRARAPSPFLIFPRFQLSIDRISNFRRNLKPSAPLLGAMTNANEECASPEQARNWAYEEFGHAELGDARRTSRLVRMTAAAARRPGGTVLDVFRTSADRQGAYDFLANPDIGKDQLLAAVSLATMRRCENHPFVFVAVDGTSLRLTVRVRAKDVCSIGSVTNGARGLKVIHAYAVSPTGVPLGILDQQWWNRVPRPRRRDCQHRFIEDKETRHWLKAITECTDRLADSTTKAWFVIDREGDRYAMLKTLQESGQWFTVRSTYEKRFVLHGAHKRYLVDVLKRGERRQYQPLFRPRRAASDRAAARRCGSAGGS